MWDEITYPLPQPGFRLVGSCIFNEAETMLIENHRLLAVALTGSFTDSDNLQAETRNKFNIITLMN